MSEDRSTRRIRFRVEEFDARTGLKTIADKARFVNTDHGYFWRIYHGQREPGGVFISRVLGAEWPTPVAFEDFFEFEEVAA